jgi:hypothetical protein
MGYEHRLWKCKCVVCGTPWIWTDPRKRGPTGHWVCDKCRTTHKTSTLSKWPGVPPTLYLGHDHNRLLKLFPVSPERAGDEWAQPYSVRSFVEQASQQLRGCRYQCAKRGAVYDEVIFSDSCVDPLSPFPEDDSHECHVLAGWTAGEPSCPLGDKILALCQTDDERKFLRTYLRYVKHRQFPMLLPQVRIGITERRRPDFVAFVPLQYWRYKWVIVELDGAHPEEKFADDQSRDQYYKENNYEVISLRPKSKGYLPEVRTLVERFEVWMNLAVTDGWEVAVDLSVVSHEPHSPDNEIPF